MTERSSRIHDEDRLRDALGEFVGLALSGLEGNQASIGRLIGLDQAEVSALRRGIYKRFSIERLFRSLSRLGWSVEVRVSAPANSKSGGRVSLAIKTSASSRKRKSAVDRT